MYRYASFLTWRNSDLASKYACLQSWSSRLPLAPLPSSWYCAQEVFLQAQRATLLYWWTGEVVPSLFHACVSAQKLIRMKHMHACSQFQVTKKFLIIYIFINNFHMKSKVIWKVNQRNIVFQFLNTINGTLISSDITIFLHKGKVNFKNKQQELHVCTFLLLFSLRNGRMILHIASMYHGWLTKCMEPNRAGKQS